MPDRRRPPLETSEALLDAGVSKPVFSCRWPETRAIVERVRSDLPRRLDARLYDAPYLGGQDAMQDVFLERWLAWRRGVVALDEAAFPYRYATAGSSEGIRECLAHHAVDSWRAGRQPVVHVFDGEYEGYAAVAEGYGIRIVRHDRMRWRESFDPRGGRIHAGDLVVVSQPSAIDGNLWSDFAPFVRHLELELPEVRAAVDLAYVGTVARAHEVDVTSPIVDTVFFSLSKVFGVYYHRIGGVLARRPMAGLVGTKWFKNTFSLELGTRLLGELPPRAIPSAHLAHQRAVVATARQRLGVPLVASDVVLIAHHPWLGDVPSIVAPLRRGNVVRYCLTPSLDRLLSQRDVPPTATTS
jgi:hypothetical protein